MHFNEILLDNRISCNFADIEGAENIIFCRPIEESLDDVAAIITKDNEFIHKFVTESNGEKTLITRVKLCDGEVFDNVRFKLVVCEGDELPYSTIDTSAFELPSDFHEVETSLPIAENLIKESVAQSTEQISCIDLFRSYLNKAVSNKAL